VHPWPSPQASDAAPPGEDARTPLNPSLSSPAIRHRRRSGFMGLGSPALRRAAAANADADAFSAEPMLERNASAIVGEDGEDGPARLRTGSGFGAVLASAGRLLFAPASPRLLPGSAAASLSGAAGERVSRHASLVVPSLATANGAAPAAAESERVFLAVTCSRSSRQEAGLEARSIGAPSLLLESVPEPGGSSGSVSDSEGCVPGRVDENDAELLAAMADAAASRAAMQGARPASAVPVRSPAAGVPGPRPYTARQLQARHEE
jgi:hypothetical protein